MTDVNLAGEDGFELLRHVRERGTPIPVIVMSGRPTQDGMMRAMVGGACRYMVKPVMPMLLRQALEEATRPPR